nr:unnamed protein product [Spirometra erinaceieuropaei]
MERDFSGHHMLQVPHSIRTEDQEWVSICRQSDVLDRCTFPSASRLVEVLHTNLPACIELKDLWMTRM